MRKCDALHEALQTKSLITEATMDSGWPKIQLHEVGHALSTYYIGASYNSRLSIGQPVFLTRVV